MTIVEPSDHHDLMEYKKALAHFEKQIHQAAAACLGLELRGATEAPPYRLTAVLSHEAHYDEVSRVHRLIFPEYAPTFGPRGGNWLAYLPGEIFLNLLPIFQNPDGGFDEVRVALVHEISHLYVVGGVPIGRDDEFIRQRVDLLRTRDCLPSWKPLDDDANYSDWVIQIAPEYIPEMLKNKVGLAGGMEIIESLTHFIVFILISELAEILSVNQDRNLEKEFLSYNEKLPDAYMRIPNFLMKHHIDLKGRLANSIFRRKIGRFVADELVCGLPNKCGCTAPFSIEEFEKKLLDGFGLIAQ